MPVDPTSSSPATDAHRQVQVVPARKIKAIGHWLGEQACPRSKRFVHDVRSFGTTLGQSLGRDVPRLSKDLVNILIAIDALSANNSDEAVTLIELGDKLREVLVSDFGYRVLDFDNLIGSSIDSFVGQVKPYETTADPSHSSGEIVGLRTPGYVFEHENGRLDVVSPAQVIVAA